MKLGIVGLPNVGKSTLFNALSDSNANSENYPFCTIEPNVSVVSVPDTRLDKLAEIYNPKKVTHAVLEFVDIAGLVEGASKGEGLGNKFLDNIRKVDLIIHMVRCFDDKNITYVYQNIDPIRDIEVITLELILKDLETLDRKLEKLKKQVKGDKKFQSYIDFTEKLKSHLNADNTAASYAFSEDERDILKDLDLDLLSLKPVIFAANFKEEELNSLETNQNYRKVVDYASKHGTAVFAICAKLEEDLNEFDEEEKRAYLKDYSQDKTGLDRIIAESYSLLGLISFLTAGTDEVRAWTIKKGTKAPQAAGKIHSDFERGFIAAEVISFDDLMKFRSAIAAKEKGMVRIEGKNYIVNDGDVILFRFNV